MKRRAYLVPAGRVTGTVSAVATAWRSRAPGRGPGRKEVRTLRLCNAAPQGTDWYRLEPTPGGGFLLASHADGRVFEIDATGKVVWKHKIVQAYSATRLANGNVLIATAESKRLIEVDRRHKIIGERKTSGYMGRVRAR